jgi:hypothetical protein
MLKLWLRHFSILSQSGFPASNTQERRKNAALTKWLIPIPAPGLNKFRWR